MAFLGENTNTASGLREMSEVQFQSPNGDRPRVPNVAVVLTDGESTWENASTIPEAIKARNNNITIFTVGVTNRVNEREIREISSLPQMLNENYFLSDTFADLSSLVGSITRQTCARIITPPPPQGESRLLCDAGFILFE